MATATTYVDEMIRFWGNVGRTFATRLQKAGRDARAGTYGYERVFSDSMAVWAEGVDAWFAAVLGRAGSEPAVVLLRIPYGTESKQRTVRVFVPGDGPPDWTELAQVGAGSPIGKEHVKVVVSDLRDELTIKLVDLETAGHLGGQYLGFVHADDRPIVILHVIVEPKRNPARADETGGPGASR
jgi:hypothetical protein